MSGYKELFGIDRPGEKEAKDLQALIDAACLAKKFIHRYHRHNNAPSPRMVWDLDAAEEAYEALDRAVTQAISTALRKVQPAVDDECKDGGRY